MKIYGDKPKRKKWNKQIENISIVEDKIEIKIEDNNKIEKNISFNIDENDKTKLLEYERVVEPCAPTPSNTLTQEEVNMLLEENKKQQLKLQEIQRNYEESVKNLEVEYANNLDRISEKLLLIEKNTTSKKKKKKPSVYERLYANEKPSNKKKDKSQN